MSHFHPWSYEGRTALILDAATPLGQTFAEELAKRGTHLIWVANAPGALPDLAARLSRWYAVQVDVLIADWDKGDATQAVYQAVQQRGLRVDLLIMIAGGFAPGQVEVQNPAHIAGQFLRQAVIVADLIQMALPPMLARGRGAIIVTAPTMKHWLSELAFACALNVWVLTCSLTRRATCREGGVQVLTLLYPCTLDLLSGAAQHQQSLSPRSSFTPARMAARALSALEKGRCVVAPGWLNALAARFF